MRVHKTIFFFPFRVSSIDREVDTGSGEFKKALAPNFQLCFNVEILVTNRATS